MGAGVRVNPMLVYMIVYYTKPECDPHIKCVTIVAVEIETATIIAVFPDLFN